jgi:hypothetical protein
MRLVLALVLLTGLTAVAQQAPAHVVGFITVDGKHPALECADQPIGTLHLRGSEGAFEVAVTCDAAPAVAFAIEVPAGRYELSLDSEQLSVRPLQVVVSGKTKLLTLGATARVKPTPRGDRKSVV